MSVTTTRVPVLLQGEAAECGLACLAMVAAAHGDQRGIAGLRGAGAGRGMNLQALVQRADALGLSSRALRIELDDLRRLATPAVLHWNMNHFVVLVGHDRDGIRIHDPAVGARRVSWSEASRAFTGVALELWPNPGFAPTGTPPSVDWRRLLGPMPGLFAMLGRIGLLALVLECISLVFPLFMQSVVDHVLVGADRDLMQMLALAFIALVCIREVVTGLRAWIARALTCQLGMVWQVRLFRHLLHLPIPFFERRSLGAILSRFASIESIQRTVAGNAVEVLMDAAMSVLLVVLMLCYSPLLTAITLLAIAASLGLTLACFPRIAEGMNQEMVQSARVKSHGVESVRGVQSLRLYAGEASRLGRWSNLLATQFNAQLGLDRWRLGLRAAANVIAGSERIVVIWLAVGMVLEQQFSVGMLIAFLAYRDQLSQRAGALLDRAFEFRLLRVHGERLADISDSEPERRDGRLAIERIESIRLSGVCVGYGDELPVLRDLDLQVMGGETVAIVGASGCGKTTLFKVLTGLLPASSGRIEINGQPLERLDLERYRSICATVMQDDQLFAGTIAENIAFFAEQIDLARVHEVAQLAAIHGDILAMPMAYETLVGDMGSSLSGGQRQRILLARALYRQPQLLLLDEATSHLDVACERLVNQAVRNLRITRIVIAHRPETIAAADRVLLIEEGRIVSDRPAAAPCERPNLPHPTASLA
jgi:ATP-binding cassette subfamily B protein RaxB